MVRKQQKSIRQRIAEALGNLKTDKSISALKFLAKDMHPQVKEAAQISLQRLESSQEIVSKEDLGIENKAN